MLELNPAMQQEFSYRNPEDDQLFQADYNHMGSDKNWLRRGTLNATKAPNNQYSRYPLWPYWLGKSGDETRYYVREASTRKRHNLL